MRLKESLVFAIGLMLPDVAPERIETSGFQARKATEL